MGIEKELPELKEGQDFRLLNQDKSVIATGTVISVGDPVVLDPSWVGHQVKAILVPTEPTDKVQTEEKE